MATTMRQTIEEAAEEATRRVLDRLGDEFGFGQIWLNEAQAARLLALSPKTLERFRSDGTGPDFVHVGRAVRYPRASVLAWAEAREQGRAAK